MWLDVATHFNCVEANAIADLLRVVCDDEGETAEAFLSAHATGDDEGDSHHSAARTTEPGWSDVECSPNESVRSR